MATFHGLPATRAGQDLAHALERFVPEASNVSVDPPLTDLDCAVLRWVLDELRETASPTVSSTVETALAALALPSHGSHALLAALDSLYASSWTITTPGPDDPDLSSITHTRLVSDVATAPGNGAIDHVYVRLSEAAEATASWVA